MSKTLVNVTLLVISIGLAIAEIGRASGRERVLERV